MIHVAAFLSAYISHWNTVGWFPRKYDCLSRTWPSLTTNIPAPDRSSILLPSVYKCNLYRDLGTPLFWLPIFMLSVSTLKSLVQNLWTSTSSDGLCNQNRSFSTNALEIHWRWPIALIILVCMALSSCVANCNVLKYDFIAVRKMKSSAGIVFVMISSPATGVPFLKKDISLKLSAWARFNCFLTVFRRHTLCQTRHAYVSFGRAIPLQIYRARRGFNPHHFPITCTCLKISFRTAANLIFTCSLHLRDGSSQTPK